MQKRLVVLEADTATELAEREAELRDGLTSRDSLEVLPEPKWRRVYRITER